MALAAAQVIDVIAARVAAASLFATSTKTDRAWPISEARLPAARVLAFDERFETISIHGPRIEQHDLDVLAELRVSAHSDLDDAMNAAAAEVLTSVGSADAVSAFRAAGIKAFSTERITRRMESEGQASVGAIDITFRARFMTRSDAPETILGATP